MLTNLQLRDAFFLTNPEEPLAEGWPGLERFARKIESMVKADYGIEVPVNASANKDDSIASERDWVERRVCKLIQFLSNKLTPDDVSFQRYGSFTDELQRHLQALDYRLEVKTD